MSRTKDGIIPVKGQTLYRVWNGNVEEIVVSAFDILPTASRPSVEYMDEHNHAKVRVSADVFFASNEAAWREVRVEAMQAIDDLNRQIRELLDIQIEAIELIRKADKALV